MERTHIRRIDFPLKDSPPKFPQYLLEMENVYVGARGVVLDVDRQPLWEAMQQTREWNLGALERVHDLVADAVDEARVVDLPLGFDYIYCLNYFDFYPFGHLWDSLQPLEKIESLGLKQAMLLMNHETLHIPALEAHLQKFGYGRERCRPVCFPRKPDRVLYRVPRLWYGSMSTHRAHWLPSLVPWMRDKYAPRIVGDPVRLYLSRNFYRRRGVSNESEVLRVLSEYGFIIFTGQEPLEEAIRLFANAEIIVGPHGSAFKNSLFSLRDPLILEFCPEKRIDRSQWANSREAGRTRHQHILAPCDVEYNIQIDCVLLQNFLREEQDRLLLAKRECRDEF